MARVLARQVPVASKHASWKQCNCCPYGYHIDLDFVRYCESVSNWDLLAVPYPRTERRLRRKNRASMEVLLGLTTQGDRLEARASEPVGDALQKAVLDFEQTLQRSSQPPHPQGWGTEETKCKQQPVLLEEWIRSDGHVNLSTSALQSIREQMAACLQRLRHLDDQLNDIPILQKKLATLDEKNRELASILSAKEKEHHEACEKLKLFNGIQKGSSAPHTRSIGFGTGVITRDVGVCHSAALVVSTGSQTDTEEAKLLPQSPSKSTLSLEAIVNSSYCPTKPTPKTVSTSTDLKMDQVYGPEDLDRNIDKAIKMYEKTYSHLLHPKKTASVTATTQTVERIKPSKEAGAQTKVLTKDASVVVKPKASDYGIQVKPQTRDIGLSANINVPDSCPKCAVKKYNVGVNFPEEKSLSLFSLGNRSKSFDYSVTKRKTFRTTGCGPDNSMSTNKSTDTADLNPKRDIGVNSVKRKLVDASVDAREIKCDKCSSPPASGTKVVQSKIPRPVTPHAAWGYSRQDTYTKRLSDSKPLQSEDYASDSGSDDGAYSSVQGKLSKRTDSTPLFQPIQVEPRKKREPSKEMKAAMKVLNDSLQKSSGSGVPHQMKNAINIIQQEWFKVSSTASANPLEVEDYLDCFEEHSSYLLEYVVNMTDVTGNTAMHYAVSHGNFDVVSILLDSKVCNINRPNAAGYTCIMLVSLAQVRSETHRQVVRRLFLMADVNVRAKQHGQTALMLAVSHGRISTVELLLESGADINIQDEDGSTALMCAAEHGHIEIVKLLLAQADCDVTITDFDGSTALNIAMEAGNRDIGVLLYAQEHFRGSSPFMPAKHRRSKSATPTLRTPNRTPSSPQPPKLKQPDHSY